MNQTCKDELLTVRYFILDSEPVNSYNIHEFSEPMNQYAEGGMHVATRMKRFMLSLPEALTCQTEEVKREKFYNKSYSEMYRKLIELGLETLEKEGTLMSVGKK